MAALWDQLCLKAIYCPKTVPKEFDHPEVGHMLTRPTTQEKPSPSPHGMSRKRDATLDVSKSFFMYGWRVVTCSVPTTP